MRLISASWLPQVISWFIDLTHGIESSQDPEEEEETMVDRIQGLYAAALDGIRSAHQVFHVLDFSLDYRLSTFG